MGKLTCAIKKGELIPSKYAVNHIRYNILEALTIKIFMLLLNTKRCQIITLKIVKNILYVYICFDTTISSHFQNKF